MRVLLGSLFLVGCVQTSEAMEPATVASGFWDQWGDGKAELSAYRLTTPRYGQSRKGRVTLVFVTERFTEGQRVKSDGGHPDEYPVLKVNEIRDFQTGIYDYNVMTSTFLRLDGGAAWGEPVKVSMSMQEWCGHVYEHLLPGSNGLAWTQHSYFDGEGDREQDLGRRSDGVLTDALPALVRGLVQPALKPGETRTLDGLSTLMAGRLRHRAPSWSPLEITVATQIRTQATPSGNFEVRDVVTQHEGMQTTWWVEVASPHRLVGWESTHGERAELIGSERLPYWMMSGEGNEKALPQLGLPEPAFVLE
ncbi:MAG: hypothetical protein AAGA48_20175 [Myxococcota bacterium]